MNRTRDKLSPPPHASRSNKMNEAETIATLNDISNVIGTFVSTWVSFTFGYLTVAYFLGKALSRFQCLTLSTLYGVTAAYSGGAAVAHVEAWHLVRVAQPTLYDNVALMTSAAGWEWGFIVFLSAGTLVSFIFMYNVRQRTDK